MDRFWSQFYMSLETSFMTFYHQIIKAEDVPDSASTRESSLSKVKAAFGKRAFKSGNSNISFDLSEIRSAYVFQYGTVFTSTVSFHFVQILRQYHLILKTLLDQDTLVICCLGGGPATELLAIVKAIERMDPNGFQRLREIRVVVVDIDSGWSVTANHVVRRLNNLSDIQYRLTFIKCDLAEPLTNELQAVLRSAHIVTVVKFLSVFHSMKGRNKTRLMLQRIIECMSRDALIFFLDSSVQKYWEVFRNSMISSECMVEIYGLVDEVYNLSHSTVKGSLSLFYRSYKRQRFCSQTVHCVSCWYKKEHQQVPSQTPAVSSCQWETNWEANPWTESCFNYQMFPDVTRPDVPDVWAWN